MRVEAYEKGGLSERHITYDVNLHTTAITLPYLARACGGFVYFRARLEGIPVHTKGEYARPVLVLRASRTVRGRQGLQPGGQIFLSIFGKLRQAYLDVRVPVR